MSCNYEQMVLSFDKLIDIGWSNDYQTKSMIVESFGKLIAGLDRFGFMTEPDDWSIIVNAYFTTINKLLENIIQHHSTRQQRLIRVDYSSFSLDQSLDSILAVQCRRSIVCRMFAFKLVHHFDLLRDLLIVLPQSDHTLR